MTSRREELNRRHLLSLCEALQQYVSDGGRVTVTTAHEPQATITLGIDDWNAFRRVLEPNAAQVIEAS